MQKPVVVKTAIISVILIVFFLSMQPVLFHPIVNKKTDTAAIIINMLGDAVNHHYEQNGRLLFTEEGIATLHKENYLKRLPSDPWGLDYKYTKLSDEAFLLVSLGSAIHGDTLVAISFVKTDSGFQVKNSIKNNDI